MFYSGELEKEIRDPNCTHRMSWSFTYNSDKDECIRKIVDEHSDRVYDHKQTSACLTAGMNKKLWLHRPLQLNEFSLANFTA